MFELMAILSGCDYLPSLPRMGIKTAHALVAQAKTPTRALLRLKQDSKHKMTSEYENDFHLAMMTFRHQRVYDVPSRKLMHLNPLPSSVDLTDLDFLGP